MTGAPDTRPEAEPGAAAGDQPEPRRVDRLPTPRDITLGALKGMRKAPAGRVRLPERALLYPAARIDERRVATYARVCGFRAGQGVPPTYPHMLAFPLHMMAMMDADFPYPLAGLVHVRNEIEQHARLDAGDRLTLTVGFGDLLAHPRGQAFSLLTTVTRDGERVWDSRSVYLHRGDRQPAGEAVAPLADGPPPLSVYGRWRVGPGIAKRYARVSGDRNPIHVSRLGARLFGFPSVIAHGMWSKARALAALLPDHPLDRATIAVDFRAPLRLPGTALLLAVTRDGQTFFDVRDGHAARVHLHGLLRAEPA